MRLQPTRTTIKTLFALSRNLCAHPECDRPLTRPEWREVAAEIAHIRGERPGAARYDASMTDDERRRFENLILLCPWHHKLIDRLEPDAYGVERLLAMKESHERRALGSQRWVPAPELDAFALQLLAQTAAELGGVASQEAGASGSLDVLRSELADLVRRTGLSHHEVPFALSSGATSQDHIDGKAVLSTGKGLMLVARALLALTTDRAVSFDAVGGLVLAGDPMAHGLAHLSGKRWFTVRKEARIHGRGHRIEGAELTTESQVVVVGDVVTTGRSLASVADVVRREAGAQVVFASALVDRGESAAVRLRRLGIEYEPLCTYRDVGLGPVPPA